MKKTCYKCKIEKDRLKDFYFNCSLCKICSKEYAKNNNKKIG